MPDGRAVATAVGETSSRCTRRVRLACRRPGKVGSNLLWQLLLQGAKYAFPFVTIPYLTRVLGPEAFAVRAFVVSAMTVVQVVLEFGFTAFGTERIARSSKSVEVARVVLGSITQGKLLLSACCVIAYFALMEVPVLDGFGVFLALSCVGVAAKAMLPDFYYLGIQQMGFLTRRFVLTQLIATGLVFLLVRDFDDLVVLACIESGSLVLGLGWSYADILLRRKVGFVWVNLSVLFDALRGASRFFVSVAAATVFAAGTTLVVGFVVEDEAEIAFWAVAITVIGAIQSLFAPVVNSLFPQVVATQDPRLVGRALRLGVPITAGISLLLWWNADFIVLVLGGPAYAQAAPVLRALAPMVVLSFPVMVLGLPFLGALGGIGRMNASTVIAAVIHAVGLALLVLANQFTLLTVAVVRNLSEFALLGLRVLFAASVKERRLSAWRHDSDSSERG